MITTDLTGNPDPPPTTVQLGVDPTTNRLSASAYDAAGNLVSRGPFTYSYDPFSMMQTMDGGGTKNTYIYTADDERIWTVDSSDAPALPWKETFTLRDLGGKVLRVFTTFDAFDFTNPTDDLDDLAWSQDYIYRDGQLLATARADGAGETHHHFHLNHLGTPLLITDAEGGTEALHSYYPFGEELTFDADTERMKFTGHERDLNEAGQTDDLDYMHARYCSPLLGRFLSVDPLGGDLWLPQTWNRYAYVLGNPLNYIDPFGLMMCRQNQRSDTGTEVDCEDTTDATAEDPGDVDLAFLLALDQFTSQFGAFKEHSLSNQQGHSDFNYRGMSFQQHVQLGHLMGQSGDCTDPNCLMLAQVVYSYENDPLLKTIMAASKLELTILGGNAVGNATGLRLNMMRYPNAGGGGFNLLRGSRRVFGLDWHRFKLNGQMVNRLHYHLGRTKSQLAKHRPWQGGWW
jgi:RHS repeat-associated protein